MSTSLSDTWLLEYSEEHLMHELSMLWETAHALPRHKEGSTEYIALLESFATHLRNLIEFFFYEPSGDYVRAEHFSDDPALWSQKKTPEINRLHERASNEVSHLTTRRISGNPPEKEWKMSEILDNIAFVAKQFAAKASDKKLHPKVREFLNLPSNEMLTWIGSNVAHSNVAAKTISGPTITAVFSAFSASTHTQIIYTTGFKKP
jgi:hypothetical protein